MDHGFRFLYLRGILMLVIPVGIPGCGKSTLATNLRGHGAMPKQGIVSRDEYREILTGDLSNQTMNDEVFRITDAIAVARLKCKQHVYLDATNLVPGWYSVVQMAAEGYNHTIVVVPFDNIEKAIIQNEKRGNLAVPAKVMDKMIARFHQAKDREFPHTPHVHVYPFDTPELHMVLRELQDIERLRWKNA